MQHLARTVAHVVILSIHLAVWCNRISEYLPLDRSCHSVVMVTILDILGFRAFCTLLLSAHMYAAASEVSDRRQAQLLVA